MTAEASDWNLVVTSQHGFHRRLRRALAPLVRLRRTVFRNVFVGSAEDPTALFEAVASLLEHRPHVARWLGRGWLAGQPDESGAVFYLAPQESAAAARWYLRHSVQAGLNLPLPVPEWVHRCRCPEAADLFLPEENGFEMFHEKAGRWRKGR